MKTKEAAAKTSFPGQHEGEVVELVFHRHPIVMRKALIFGMLVILVGVLPLLVWPLASAAIKVAIFTPIISLLYWFYAWIGWYYTVYIVTDQRLIEVKQRGFFNRRVSEYGIDKIQNVNYHIRGLQAVIFGYGDITAQTYVGDVVMKTIHKPVEIHAQIIKVLHRSPSSTPPGI